MTLLRYAEVSLAPVVSASRPVFPRCWPAEQVAEWGLRGPILRVEVLEARNAKLGRRRPELWAFSADQPWVPVERPTVERAFLRERPSTELPALLPEAVLRRLPCRQASALTTEVWLAETWLAEV